MALPGLVAANNLSDVVDKEKAWDNLGLSISADVTTPEAEEYIAAVEQADGQALEQAVKDAIVSFVVGCKNDGIWPSIKACCILAGARTLNGALVPLVGPLPTNNNFVSADYNRKTGLAGNGSTKRLDTNRNNADDPQNNNHNAIWVTTPNSYDATRYYLLAGNAGTSGGNSFVSTAAVDIIAIRSRSALGDNRSFTGGFVGSSRSNAANCTIRANSTNTTANRASQVPQNVTVSLFDSGNCRIAFYSIGESLDLAKLDTRVTTLMNAFASAIP